MTELFSGLGNRLVVFFLVVSLIPIMALSSYVYFDQVNTKSQSINTRLASYSESLANKISLWMEERKGDVVSMASNDITVSKTNILANSKSSTNQIFSARFALENNAKIDLGNHDWLLDYYISDRDSRILFYTGLVADETIRSQEHFADALDGKMGISEVHKTAQYLPNESGVFEKNLPTILISAPIKSEVETVGVFTARVDFFKIPHFDFANAGFESLDVYVLDSGGHYLSKPRFYPQSDFAIRPELELAAEGQLVEEISSLGPALSEPYMLEYDDTLGRVTSSITHIPPTDWFVISKVAKAEALSEVFDLQVIITTVILILAISIIGVSIFISKKLVEPIEGLIESTKKISQGDLDSEITQKGQDEINRLATAFEDMRLSLKESTKLRKEAEQKYKAIYESAPALYRTVDLNGVIKDCNNLYATKLGYTKDEVIGTSIFEHVSDKSRSELSSIFEEWKKTGSISNREVYLRARDGSEIPALLSATNLYDSTGVLLGSNTVLKDISDIRIMEKELLTAQAKMLRQRFEAIGELSARMAHDIRNPLAVIKTQVELLRMEMSSQSSLAAFERIHRSIDRISHQIEHVMEYLKEKELTIERHRLRNIINGSLESLSIPSTISIVQPGGDVVMSCDAKKMEVVFSNLILNSIQAMKQVGSIYIGAELKEDLLLIEVEDSGPGIAEEDLPRIFEPLFTTKMEGTGLGLASCKKIIEQHGGTIEVLNKPTRFIIKLPKEIRVRIR